MKILVLNQHYWPEIAATAQILSDLCEDLAAAGHDVTVVTGQPSYKKVEGLADKQPAREVHKGVHIRRVWTYGPGTRSAPARALHYGSYFTSSFVAAAREIKPDVALVLSTPPLLLGLWATAARVLRGVPFVYSVQDLFPDALIDMGVMGEGTAYRAIDRISKKLYRQADRVVTLSDAMGERLVAKGVDRSILSVVPNWADTDTLTPTARNNDFARAHGLANRFVVQYSGNMGLCQGLEHVLEAARRVPDLPITFALIGDGGSRASLERMAKDKQLDNVVFLPPQPRDRLPDLLGACDIGLVPMKRGMSAHQVPSKLYGILASGRPVLASVDQGSEVAQVIERFGAGVAIPPEDPQALADSLRKLYIQSSDLPTMGQSGRRAAETHFSRRVCTQKYEEVLLAAAGRQPSTAAPSKHQSKSASVHSGPRQPTRQNAAEAQP